MSATLKLLDIGKQLSDGVFFFFKLKLLPGFENPQRAKVVIATALGDKTACIDKFALKSVICIVTRAECYRKVRELILIQ